MRAIAKGVFDIDGKAKGAVAADTAIDAVAAAAVQLDAEHAYGVTVVHAGIGWIVGFAISGYSQCAGIRRCGKPRRAGQQSRPDIAGRIDRAGNQKRQLRVKILVLVGHEIAD